MEEQLQSYTIPRGYSVHTHRERTIPAAEVRRLYGLEGWWPKRSDAEIAAVLSGAPAVGAWHGDRLVGFARSVVDTHLRAYIEDVVVHPEHRRSGLATAVLARLIGELRESHLVSLFSSAELTALYERLGFRATRQVVMHRDSDQAAVGRDSMPHPRTSE